MEKQANRKPLLTVWIFVPAVIFISYYCLPVLATTYYVNPGESIQTAIDGASYGDYIRYELFDLRIALPYEKEYQPLTKPILIWAFDPEIAVE